MAGTEANQGDRQVDGAGQPFSGTEAQPVQLRYPVQGTFEGLGVSVPQDPVSRAMRGEPPFEPETDPETEGTRG